MLRNYKRFLLTQFAFLSVFQFFPIWLSEASVTRLREKHQCYPENSSEITNSFLWMVNRDPPAYFFGTIHVPYLRVWDFIPANTKQAFRDSENVFFELDLTDSHTLADLTNCQMLPKGENLSNVLPEAMFNRLKDHLEYVKTMLPSWITADQRGMGLYADYLFNAIAGNWERKRPVWVMLMVNTLTEIDIKSRGVPVLDLYLAQQAVWANKRTGAIERVEEQCLPFNELNFSQVLFALNRTLWQQESLRHGTLQDTFSTDDLIWHYNCGNLDTMVFNLDTAQVQPLINSTLSAAEIAIAQEIDNYFAQELIFKRNMRMASRVKEIIEAFPKNSFFFAFGAGHFLGNNSIIELLQREGVEIENIPAGQELPLKSSQDSEDQLYGTMSEFYENHRKKLKRQRNRHKSHHHNQEADSNHLSSQSDRPYDDVAMAAPPRQFNDLWIPLQSVQAKTERPSSDKLAATVLPNQYVGGSAAVKPSRFVYIILVCVLISLLLGRNR